MLFPKSSILCLTLTFSVLHTVNTHIVSEIVEEFTATKDILSILVWGTVFVSGNCSAIYDTSQVQYWLYTRTYPNDSVIIMSYNQIDASKPTIFLIHGWNGNGDDDAIRPIKKAYLKRYDCNIISVNYQKYAAANYQTAYCYIPTISYNIAQFICNMSKTLNINVSDLHVVGHSLGGQAAGFVGKSMQTICGTLGRITALDPAGPLYQSVDAVFKLAKTDAAFVQVIHTNQGQFGYNGDCGDVDFYPNCGFLQPGCIGFVIKETFTIRDIIQIPIRLVKCSHQRSCYLFAESINNNGFYSTSCESCDTPTCGNQTIGATHAYMGESCRSKPKGAEYTLITNDKSPYAKGPEGPLD